MNITRRLAEFCHETANNGVPKEVENQARVCLADALHAILLALSSKTSVLLNEYIKTKGQRGSSSMAGQGLTDPETAALFNSCLAAVHEIDDVHFDTSLHPGAAIVPAALACAELSGAPVERFLTAIAIGYEIAVRLSRAAGYRHYHYFHSSATCCTVGAAAAACVALNLTVDETHSAFGIAATSASGLWEGISDDAVMVKHLHLGQAAERGVRAALLAGRGWPGARKSIEGPKGFLAAMARPGEHAPGENGEPDDIKKILTEDLGENWAILRNIFKRYPFCLGVFEPLEGLLGALRQSHYDLGQIDNIYVETSLSVAWMVGNRDPKNEEEARFSVPYGLALVLSGFDPETVPLPVSWLKEDNVRKWLPRVHMQGRRDIGRRKAKVSVVYTNGKKISADRPLRNLTEDEVFLRLNKAAWGCLGPQSANLAELIANISSIHDLKEMCFTIRSEK